MMSKLSIRNGECLPPVSDLSYFYPAYMLEYFLLEYGISTEIPKPVTENLGSNMISG